MNKELKLIIKKADIYLLDKENHLLIKSKFNLLNKSNLGVISFLLGGLFLFVISILKGNDYLSIIIISIFGGAISILSALIIIKQATDFLEITNGKLRFMNSLKSKTFTLDSSMKVKIKAETEYIKLKSQPGSGSYFRIIELFLVHNNSKYRIFDFQVDEKYSNEANKFGSELLNKIKKRINTSNNT